MRGGRGQGLGKRRSVGGRRRSCPTTGNETEIGDLLSFAILGEPKLARAKTGDQPALPIGDYGIDLDEVDIDPDDGTRLGLAGRRRFLPIGQKRGASHHHENPAAKEGDTTNAGADCPAAWIMRCGSQQTVRLPVSPVWNLRCAGFRRGFFRTCTAACRPGLRRARRR